MSITNWKLCSSDSSSSDSSTASLKEVGEEKYGPEEKYHQSDNSVEFLENIDKKHKIVVSDRKALVHYEEKGNDLRDSSGKKLNLIVWFGVKGCAARKISCKAARKISCKASEYPTDILKRVKNMYIKKPDIQLKDLIICRYRSRKHHRGDNKRESDRLPHRTLRELGIRNNQRIWVICKKVASDWIPLPVTGDDVWIYLTNNGYDELERDSFFKLTRKLGIHDRCEVDKVWGLIQSTGTELLDKKGYFYEIFPENDNFLDTFYQAFLNTVIILSESYIHFFTKMERLVWQDFHIPLPEKERVIMSEVNLAIKDAVLKNGHLNSRIAGLILCFYGKSAIRLPYSVNSRERFFLRKEGIEKGQLHLEKLIVTEVVERAKNDIYERLIMASLAECKDNLLYNTEVSVQYVLHPDLVRDTLSKHFIHRRAHTPDVRYKRKSRQSRSMIASDTVYKSLTDHFEGDGFKVSEMEILQDYDRYSPVRRNSRRGKADSDEYHKVVAGLTISWRSQEDSSFTDNLGRNTDSL